MRFRIRFALFGAITAVALTGFSANAGEGYVRDSVLYIPGGTRAVRAYSFADRDDFREIRFEAPVKVTEIGEYAFLGCCNLREVSLPRTVRTLGEGCFRECTGLRMAVLPSGLTALPRYLFAWCGSLEEVEMPSGLTDIAAHAFAYCGALEEIDIPCSVTHIGSNAFSFCGSLREVSVPDAVTELESYAFSECVSLRSARLPGRRDLLGELIFSGCRALERIEEPSAVPPAFDCDSRLFEENESWMYSECVLYVPAGSMQAYREARGWSCFDSIEAISSGSTAMPATGSPGAESRTKEGRP